MILKSVGCDWNLSSADRGVQLPVVVGGLIWAEFCIDAANQVTYNNFIMKPKIVIDTNVIIAALKSQRGAANLLLSLFGTKKFTHSVSVALVLEYEEVIKRLLPDIGERKINHLLDYICAASENTRIYYLWRPILRDPEDDMILELAVAAQSDFIVTYNQRDFKETKRFGIKIVTPRELLTLMGEL